MGRPEEGSYSCLGLQSTLEFPSQGIQFDLLHIFEFFFPKLGCQSACDILHTFKEIGFFLFCFDPLLFQKPAVPCPWKSRLVFSIRDACALFQAVFPTAPRPVSVLRFERGMLSRLPPK